MRRPGRAVVVGGLAVIAVAAIGILAPTSSASTSSSASTFADPPFTFGGKEFVVPTTAGSGTPTPTAVPPGTIEGGPAARFCAGEPPAPVLGGDVPQGAAVPTDADTLVICPFIWGPGAQQVAVVHDAAAVSRTASAINAFTSAGCEYAYFGDEVPVVRAVFLGGAAGPMSVVLHREIVEPGDGSSYAVTGRYDDQTCGSSEVIDGLLGSAGNVPRATFDFPLDWWSVTGATWPHDSSGAQPLQGIQDPLAQCELWLALDPPAPLDPQPTVCTPPDSDLHFVDDVAELPREP